MLQAMIVLTEAFMVTHTLHRQCAGFEQDRAL